MKKKKILIIEDEKGMREALDEVFSGAGYEVFIAEDGQIGIDLVAKEDLDVILLDIILPKKDGFEVLREIKELKINQTTPIILCTNLSEPDDIQKALDLGATTYLVKANYKLEDVLRKVEEVIESN